MGTTMTSTIVIIIIFLRLVPHSEYLTDSELQYDILDMTYSKTPLERKELRRTSNISRT